MKFTPLIVLTVFCAALLTSPVFAKEPTPVCGGKNLFTGLQDTDPQGYQDLLKKEQSIPNGTGLLWKIERDGLLPSYLFGTMHISDDRLTNLPSPVTQALDQSDIVALELSELIDNKKMASEVVKNIALIAFLDGRTLDRVLAPKQLQQVKKTLEKYKMPYAGMRIMKPWFVMLSVSLPLCEMERIKAGREALDAVLARRAQKRGAKIVGLETVREQFSLFNTLSLDEQKSFLMSALHNQPHLDDQIETMTQLYVQRRTAALWQFSLYLSKKASKDSGISPAEQKRELAAFKKFENALITKRNKTMRDKSLALLKQGKLFIAVGAAHLPGKDGLVALLKQAGYKLTVLY